MFLLAMIRNDLEALDIFYQFCFTKNSLCFSDMFFLVQPIDDLNSKIEF